LISAVDEQLTEKKKERPMKLLLYGPKGSKRPALVDKAGKLRDLSGMMPDVSSPALSPESLAKLLAVDHEALPEVTGSYRTGPCVGSVGDPARPS
jgi:ureidoglycolate lyase